ncbi:MAG: COP23 domain-containing protein [Thermosynechococcaceae cyanobacterium]
MGNYREHQWSQRLGVRRALRVGLAGTMAIALANGGLSWAGSATDLPNVEAGTAAPPSAPSSSTGSQGTMTATKSSTLGTSSTSPRFFCQVWGGQYTVMYNPESRPNESFPWAVPQNMGGGWVAEKRCGEISRRLEEYRPDGLLELTNSTENGYNIVCATTQAKPACRIVFTVPRGQDPVTTRNAVFQNLTVADSGKMTQGVNTFVGQGGGNLNLNGDLVNLGLSILGGGPSWGNNGLVASDEAIDLTPYLDPSDGGTGVGMKHGVRLQKGVSLQKGARLNPDNFR